MEFIIILGLILLNGVFSMTEMSLVSVRKYKLTLAIKKGRSGARTALSLSENPTRFLSTVQIGITLIGILIGFFSGETYGKILSDYIGQIPLLTPYAYNIAIAIIVIVVTYVTIVLGELIPKRLGLLFPESVAILLAKPMYVLSLIASPFVWLLSVSNDLILKILGIKSKSDHKISEEEIKIIVKESAKGGEIQKVEQDIVERVFELGDTRVSSLLTLRNDVVYLNESIEFAALKKKIGLEKHSIYPVCRNDNLDEILGIVSLNDLFTAFDDDDFKLRRYLKIPLYVNEKNFAYRLLELFKRERTHFAIVVDEYGVTKGIVTMDDVIDSLVGDVSQESDDQYELININEKTWLVDGQYSVFEFMKYFELVEEESISQQFVTVAGLFIHKLERLPEVGDKIILDSYELEVLEKQGQRIGKIQVIKL